MTKLLKKDRVVLEAVLVKIRKTHWIQRSYFVVKQYKTMPPKECACLVGLVNMEYGSNPATHSGMSIGASRTRVLQVLAEVAGVIRNDLEIWNDTRRSKNGISAREQVAQLVEKALAQ